MALGQAFSEYLDFHLSVSFYPQLLNTCSSFNDITLATVMTVKENPNSCVIQSVKMMIYRKRVEWNNMAK